MTATGWGQALEDFAAFLDEVEAVLAGDDVTALVDTPWTPPVRGPAAGDAGPGEQARAEALLGRAAGCEQRLREALNAVRADLDEVSTRRTAAARYRSDGEAGAAP